MGEVCGDFRSGHVSQSLNDSVQSAERLIASLSEVVSARELSNGDAVSNAETANADSPGIIRSLRIFRGVCNNLGSSCGQYHLQNPSEGFCKWYCPQEDLSRLGMVVGVVPISGFQYMLMWLLVVD